VKILILTVALANLVLPMESAHALITLLPGAANPPPLGSQPPLKLRIRDFEFLDRGLDRRLLVGCLDIPEQPRLRPQLRDLSSACRPATGQMRMTFSLCTFQISRMALC
jgi:hypothetical protein